MKVFSGRSRSLFLQITFAVLLTIVSRIHAIRTDLYLNKDKFGEFLRLDISEKGCTNVPLNWDNQAFSLDTHGSCVKFYDLPYCRGKYVALQPYHGTFQDNLETIGFKHIISSASPCGPKVPTGRYYILNGADGSLLTIDRRNDTVAARTMPFKPYITKNQQFQIDKISLADYEIIPRVHENLNPLTYDMSISTRQHPVRRTWKIESVYRGKYVIKNEWNNRCLYKSESGKVDEHECVSWSPNQEWIFKSIKVQPFFPSKEEINKKPVRPDEQFPFQPQQELPLFPNFPHPPHLTLQAGQPLEKENKKKDKDNKKKNQTDSEEEDEEDEEEEADEEETEDNELPLNKPHTRPNPIVINPREPFPPVQPHPIYPKNTVFLPPLDKNGKPDFSKPPVPQVRHPGQNPFPRDPIVTDPKKPLWPPALFGAFGPTAPPTTQAAVTTTKKPTSDEEDEEDEEEDRDEEDDKEDDKKEADESKEDNRDDDKDDEKEELDSAKVEDDKDEEDEKEEEEASVEKEEEE